MTYLRRLANATYRRRIRVFDKLNGNVDFVKNVPLLFADAKHVEDTCDLYRFVNNVTLRNVPIDYLEFGVFEGQSIRKWLLLNQHETSRFIGFDTFTGLPEDWTPDKPAGTFNARGHIPSIADERVRFIPGLFQRTLIDFMRSFHVKNQLVVHIDCDLYSAALFCLATLDRHMPPGTVVIFDEFYDVLHEFAAFRDYCASFTREARGIAYTDDHVQVAVSLA